MWSARGKKLPRSRPSSLTIFSTSAPHYSPLSRSLEQARATNENLVHRMVTVEPALSRPFSRGFGTRLRGSAARSFTALPLVLKTPKESLLVRSVTALPLVRNLTPTEILFTGFRRPLPLSVTCSAHFARRFFSSYLPLRSLVPGYPALQTPA